MKQPHIVALGGTLRPTSGTAAALERALAHAAMLGARTTLLTGPAIDFPNYEPETAQGNARIQSFLRALRDADGRFRLITLRSNDQFNTTVYGYDDRFRGIKGTRQVAMMNEADIARLGLKDGDRIALGLCLRAGRFHLPPRTAKDVQRVADAELGGA